jgi:tetratricopeptide (TPR) repeat protein
MAAVVPARSEPAPRAGAWRWLPPAGLVLALILAYANTLHAPFLFDDTGAVLHNPTIRRLDSLAIFLPPADGSTTTGRPVVNASFAFNYAVSGENVWSYHALNLAIHAAAALALFGLVRRTLASLSLNLSSFNRAAAALAAAALWALHPLQTESVTCIAQRTESLCGLFYLLTLYAFARATLPAVQPPSGWSALTPTRWLALSVVSSALGMATKEVMVTAPVLVFLFDRTFVARSFAAAWRARRIYYVALAATWLGLLALLFLGSGARGASAGFGLGVTGWTYLLKQGEAVLLYLRLAGWPYPLVLDYGTAVGRPDLLFLGQGLAVVALLAATCWALVRRPVLGFFGAWFFLILAPSSSVVPLVTQTMAEHRMYLPLAAVVVPGAVALFVRFGARAAWVLGGAILLGGAATVARNADYRDVATIWAETVRRRPDNPRAHHNLALALHRAGRLPAAHGAFAHAVALDPAYVVGHYNWGVALLADDRVAEATAAFVTTVRLVPDHADAHRQLARLAEQGGRPAEAENHFNAVLRLAPDDLDAHRRLGLLLARAERLGPAEGHFRAILRLVPADADAHANLGNVLLLGGRPREAIACYEQSLRLRPADDRTRENLQVAREGLR